MSTFQAVVYGIVYGFSEFLPISSAAHSALVAQITGWPQPAELLQGYFALGALLAIFFYFIHDWASMISSFLSVVLFRKKPMTLDERMPFFLMIATLPPVAAWYYLKDGMPEQLTDPLWMIAGLVLFSLLLALGEYMSRKNKGMFDWNWIDAFIIGVFQILMLVPACGRSLGALSGGMLRNYNREAIAKVSFFAAAPLLAGSAWLHLRGFGAHPAATLPEGTSWITVGVALMATTLTALLVLGGFMKQIARKNLNTYGAYRVMLAMVFGLVLVARTKGWLH